MAASTGQYRGLNADARQPGATAAQLIAEYPALAAATGGIPVAAARPAEEEKHEYTSGKSTAENYIFKPPVKEKDKPSYYEFIHGALKMMRYRVQYDEKPVLEYLVYYEKIANLACQYKWWSVYDLHQCLAEDVRENRSRWDAEIATTDIHRYCKERDQVPTAYESGESRKSRRDSHRNNRSRDDRSESHSHSRESNSRARDGTTGVCRKYNKEPGGCSFGDSCQFDHKCAECDRVGLKEIHPAMWCPRTAGGAGGGTLAGNR